jgi:hypothetical protein
LDQAGMGIFFNCACVQSFGTVASSTSLVTARVFFSICFCQSFKAISSLSQPAAVVVFSLDDQYSRQGVETFLL